MKSMKKFFSVLLAITMICTFAIPATAASNNGKGNSKVATVALSTCRLHQYTGEPIHYDAEEFYEGLEFSLNPKNDETANIPGYGMGYEDAIFWHFVNPDKLGGTADITFIDKNGSETILESVKPYKAGQHWGVITPLDWELLDASYTPGTASPKGDTLFNLSHTAGGGNSVNSSSPSGSVTPVRFTKDIGRTFAEEVFSFELYKVIDGEEKYIATYNTDNLGVVSFTLGDQKTKEVEEAGDYVIYEIPQAGWTQKTYTNGLNFTISSVGVVAWTLEPQDYNEPIIVNKENIYNFWAGIHLSTEGIGTTTVTMGSGEQYVIPGAGWGFTYVKAEGLSKTNPLVFNIIGNKKIYGTVTLSLNENLELVVTIERISISAGKESVKIMVSRIESDMNKHSNYDYKISPPQMIDGKYTIVIPSSVFDMNNYLDYDFSD